MTVLSQLTAAVRSAWLLWVFLLGILPAYADVDGPEFHTQGWGVVTLIGPKSSRLQALVDVIARVNGDEGQIDLAAIRPGLGIKLNEHLQVWGGYSYVPRFQPRRFDEHQLWQQAVILHRMGRVSGFHRVRFEERFLENTPTLYRLRVLDRGTLPLGKTGRWSLIGFNEVWFNLNNQVSSAPSGFQLNRTFIGLGRTLGRSMRLEGGYMVEFQNVSAPRQDQVNSSLFLHLFIQP